MNLIWESERKIKFEFKDNNISIDDLLIQLQVSELNFFSENHCDVHNSMNFQILHFQRYHQPPIFPNMHPLKVGYGNSRNLHEDLIRCSTSWVKRYEKRWICKNELYNCRSNRWILSSKINFCSKLLLLFSEIFADYKKTISSWLIFNYSNSAVDTTCAFQIQ